ncbi:MFS transporter [Microbacterium gorillae]|uniref:MFS transporter n=1 Tax=Microbacterium gorillae TaxID=1231063 RepID=UPI000590322F|nr:MFS transporter [Microbacterium gorillae]
MSTEKRPLGQRPWWVASVAGMASYIDAAAITSFSVAIISLQSSLGLTDLQVGGAAGGLAASIAVGALIGGRLGDRFGRRPVFTVTMVAIIVGMLALAFAPTYPLILGAVILVGLATGADLPVSLATISEAADDHNRGRLIGFTNLLWLAGIVVNGILAAVFGDLGRPGAQVLFLHVAAVAVVVLLARLSIPESGRWLAARAERAQGVHTVRADRAGFRDLLRAPFLVPFVALIVFSALTNLQGNTNGQYLTYIMVTMGGLSVTTATLIALPSIPLTILGFVWFMKIADGPHRMRYFAVGAVALLASALTLAVFGVSVPSIIASTVFNAVGASFAFEGIQRVWSQEQFPTLLRTTAQGGIISIARIAAAILAVFTPTLLHTIGVQGVYAGLAVLSTIGLVWAWVVFRRRDAQDEFDLEDATDTAAGSADLETAR